MTTKRCNFIMSNHDSIARIFHSILCNCRHQFTWQRFKFLFCWFSSLYFHSKDPTSRFPGFTVETLPENYFNLCQHSCDEMPYCIPRVSVRRCQHSWGHNVSLTVTSLNVDELFHLSVQSDVSNDGDLQWLVSSVWKDQSFHFIYIVSFWVIDDQFNQF